MSFEELMKRLDEIVVQLESGNVDLDTSITLFEEGIALSKKAQVTLEGYQEKVNSLISGENFNEKTN